MLYDRYMDELVDTFQPGFAEAVDSPLACPFDRSEKTRHAAWMDGPHYSRRLIAQYLYCRESNVLRAGFVPLIAKLPRGHSFVRTYVSFGGVGK